MSFGQNPPFPAEKTHDVGLRHYCNARGSWKVGFSHFFLRVRGISITVIATVATMGFPWWWPEKLGKVPQNFELSIRYTALIIAICLVVLVVSSALFVGHRSRRSLALKEKLHDLAHELRDSYDGVLSRTKGVNSKHHINHEHKHLLASSQLIAEKIVSYLSILTGADCVGCNIRLGQDLPNDGKDVVEYVTVARAGSLDYQRKGTSQPIRDDEDGIPKFFLSEKVQCSGVLFVHDIKAARLAKIYKSIENEDKFDDYNCCVIVPLNGWNGKRKGLLGILTITGRSQRKILKVQNVDVAKMLGDMLANHYAAVVARLSASKRLPFDLSENVNIEV